MEVGRFELRQELKVVAAGPVFDDEPVDDPPEVHVPPSDRAAGRFAAGEQWHGRAAVGAVDGHVVGDELAVGQYVVVFEGDGSEIGFDHRDDRLPAGAALRIRGVVDEVDGYQVVDA